MSRNGSGTYSLPAGNPVVTGTTISSTWANTTLTDIANALTGSLAADGQTTASGNLNMGTNKIVNAADPTAQQDVATKYYTDTSIAAGLLTVTPAYVSDKVNTATGYFQVPQGSTAQRPGTPLNGIVRYNSDLDIYEGYINGDWVRFQTYSQSLYTISYLVVAGGGGGAYGGGGAGGLLTGTTTVIPGTSYPIVIGAGGTAGVAGNNSTGVGQITAGGGGGNGGNGGSGSGANDSGSPGLGTVGQGNRGGYGQSGANPNISGGGGGAGSVGGDGTTSRVCGSGGIGIASTIIGYSSYYAGGGGGGSGTAGSTGGAGGLGGGGAGGGQSNGSNGSTNTGGGGGGGSPTAGNGGSGIAVVSYANTTQIGTGGTVTSYVSGSTTYWVHTFTSSGTYIA